MFLTHWTMQAPADSTTPLNPNNNAQAASGNPSQQQDAAGGEQPVTAKPKKQIKVFMQRDDDKRWCKSDFTVNTPDCAATQLVEHAALRQLAGTRLVLYRLTPVVSMSSPMATLPQHQQDVLRMAVCTSTVLVFSPRSEPPALDDHVLLAFVEFAEGNETILLDGYVTTPRAMQANAAAFHQSIMYPPAAIADARAALRAEAKRLETVANAAVAAKAAADAVLAASLVAEAEAARAAAVREATERVAETARAATARAVAARVIGGRQIQKPNKRVLRSITPAQSRQLQQENAAARRRIQRIVARAQPREWRRVANARHRAPVAIADRAILTVAAAEAAARAAAATAEAAVAAATSAAAEAGLPPYTPKTHRIFVFLDLDQTMLLTDGDCLEKQRPQFAPDIAIGGKMAANDAKFFNRIQLRPGAHKFLHRLLAVAEVGVVTAGDLHYARAAVTHANNRGWATGSPDESLPAESMSTKDPIWPNLSPLREGLPEVCIPLTNVFSVRHMPKNVLPKTFARVLPLVPLSHASGAPVPVIAPVPALAVDDNVGAWHWGCKDQVLPISPFQPDNNSPAHLLQIADMIERAAAEYFGGTAPTAPAPTAPAPTAPAPTAPPSTPLCTEGPDHGVAAIYRDRDEAAEPAAAPTQAPTENAAAPTNNRTEADEE